MNEHGLNTQELNTRFKKIKSTSFHDITKGLIKIVVNNQYSSAEIHLQGAHLTSFYPHSYDDVLWLSPIANYEAGKAIRGGIPICWPWFGQSGNNKLLPQHGFARTSQFNVESICENEESGTIIELSLNSNNQTLSIWPFDFNLMVKFTIADSLKVEVITHNPSKLQIEVSEAIHSYFSVGDISQLNLSGLNGMNYFNQLTKLIQVDDSSNLTVGEELDQIYQCPDTILSLVEDGNPRVQIDSDNANSIVVWNPWIDKAASMTDFPDNGYRNMICVETANIQTNGISNTLVIDPHQSHTISQTISICKQF